MNNPMWFINQTLFLINLFVFTYKFLIKVLNRWFPPYQDPNFFAKELFSPEPYEIPLYLGLTFIWVVSIYFGPKIFKVLAGGSIRRVPQARRIFPAFRWFEHLREGKSRRNLPIQIVIFIFLLGIFFINIGVYPLQDNTQYIQSPVDSISSNFIFTAYLSLITLIILAAHIFKKSKIIIIPLILVTITLFTFEPRFPLSSHDVTYFLGPIYEISHGKTIFTTTSSLYGFLSILSLGFLYQLKIFNPFYLPFLTWLLYIMQYFLSFLIIYKSSKSIIVGLLGLFSILTLNYFSLFHFPISFPQIGPFRWLPLIISLFLLQRYQKLTNLKFIFSLSLLSLWNIETGIALFLTYSFTLFLLVVSGKIDLKKLIRSVGLLVFNIFLFFITLNIIHFLLGKPLIDYIAASNRLRDFAVSGIAMIPMPWRTHFWFVLLVYFATIIYFFRSWVLEIRNSENSILLFSANLSLFAGIYYIGRSHPHNLFHISIFFLLNVFLLLSKIFEYILHQNKSKKTLFSFYLIIFTLFIVYPGFSRKQALATMIKTKFDNLKKEQIFRPELEKQVKNFYLFEAEMIRESLIKDEILILSVDDTYLFYLVDKKNLLLDNPQSGLASASKKELKHTMEKILKTCPQKIAVNCTLFGCPEYSTFNHEAVDVQKIILDSLEKSCKVKYELLKCTHKICIASSI